MTEELDIQKRSSFRESAANEEALYSARITISA